MLRKLSPRGRTILGVVVIIFATIMVAIYAPPQRPSPIMGPEPVATVLVTNSQGILTVDQEIEFKGVHLTIKQVELAEKFSDDRSRGGKYTLRLRVETINKGEEVIGVNYAEDVYLILPDGESVRTKRMSIKPSALPGQLQTGYFDYPLNQAVELSELKVRFSDGQIISFAPASS